MRNLAKNISGHAFLFGASKSSVLVAPFLSAWLLSSDQYGALEWWLSLSMTLGPIMTLGVYGVIAYGSLGGVYAPYVKVSVIFICLVCFLSLIIFLLLPVFGFDWEKCFFGVVILQSVMVVLQLALSARLKGLGLGAWASLAESGLYITLLLALLLMMLVDVRFVLGFIGLMIVAVIFMLCLLVKLSDLPAVHYWRHQDYKVLFSHSYRFLIGGVLMATFMAGPRLILGGVAESTVVASFSIVFRWISISIVLHQFINTVFFKRIYSGDMAKRRNALWGCIGVVAVFAIFIALVATSEIARSIGLPLPHADDTWLVWSITGIVTLWSASACLEGVLNSSGHVLSQSSAVALGLFVFLTIFGGLYYMESGDQKVLITIAWASGFITIVATQLMIIFRLRLLN